MPTAKIIIDNEATCKIQGLDVVLRNKLVAKFKFDIPGARFTPAVKLGRWDGKKAFMQLSGQTYINLLPEILPILDNAGYDIDLEDLRDYNNQFSFEEVNETSYSNVIWPKGHKHEGESLTLRDDQVNAINMMLRNTQSLSSLPTGFGKCLDGETMLTLNLDLTTPFGRFMLNKLQQEPEIKEEIINQCKEFLNGN